MVADCGSYFITTYRRRRQHVEEETEKGKRKKEEKKGTNRNVKNEESGLNIFFSHFYFLFNLFSSILFLELELGLEWQDHTITQQITSDDTGYKSHDAGKDVEGSGRRTSYNV